MYFGDNPTSRYSPRQKQNIVERRIVETARSRGWSALLTYRAIKDGLLIVHPAVMDWDDDFPASWWEYAPGFSRALIDMGAPGEGSKAEIKKCPKGTQDLFRYGEITKKP